MDTLVEHYLATPKMFDFNHHRLANIQKQNHMHNYDNEIEDLAEHGGGSSSPVHYSSSSSPLGLEGQGDPNDPMLKYINQMLMEEDELENKPCMFHDCSALLAAEKSFSDVLNEPKKTLSFGFDQETAESPSGGSVLTYASPCSRSRTRSPSDFNHIADQFVDISSFVEPLPDNNASHFTPFLNLQPSAHTNSFLDASRELDESLMSLVQTELNLDSSFLPQIPKLTNLDLDLRRSFDTTVVVEGNEWNVPSLDSSKKKNHKREDNDLEEESRITKQLASCDEESLPLEMYDQVLLCPQLNPHMGREPSSDDALKVETSNKLQQMEQSLVSSSSSKGKPRGGRKSGNPKKEVVDLRSLLVQCAQAVAAYDIRTMNELLKRIRQHSSPHGDGVERLAFYFANSLEARLNGTGTTMYASFRTRRISAADILKGYQMYITACPFKKVSNIFANRWIGKLASGETRLHIIDFGILYGFQWPCLIQRLSVRPGGPPMLRITGVDLPQPGLRPAERVVETGQRLARYCQRFGVPFEYNAIAKKWENIKVQDFKIKNDEFLVVNCHDRFSFIPDETVLVDSPRDAVLNLIKSIRPGLFIHGVVNGTYNSPFFVTRFREALFHFSSLFDMFEATVPRETKERELFEQEIFARDALNVIACEGTERVDRPETYKQWQVRHFRAGFKKLPLDREIMSRVKAKVKLHYHKDFLVDEDNNWMLQGWKGRVTYAISCWL